MIMGSYLQHLAIAVLLMACGTNGRALDDLDNSIQSVDTQTTEPRDWVTISEAPPSKIMQPIGSSVELECEVSGSPPPTIRWIRGSNALNAINNYESNMISESSPQSFIRMRSRLIIDHVSPSERSYTCVGQSGGKTVHATSTVYGSPGNMPHNISELIGLDSQKRAARIVFYYNSIFELMGGNVVLPCSVAGRPSPDIYWMDNEDRIINGKSDSHLRVLPSGALLIAGLKWSDMGSYTCIARNPLGKDSISTFVYPVLNEY